MFMVKWLRKRLPHQLSQEDGAVTVDWVVMTGLVIALCLALVALMNDAFVSGGTSIQNSMSSTK